MVQPASLGVVYVARPSIHRDPVAVDRLGRHLPSLGIVLLGQNLDRLIVLVLVQALG